VRAMSSALLRLSSGQRINSASDDPSGLAISSAMRAQISGKNVAVQNIEDGINLMRTQDAALNEIQDMINRMRDLSLRASNEAAMTTRDLERMRNEFNSLRDEIDQIAKSTSFNGIKVLLGNPTTSTTDLEFSVTWWTPDTDLDIHVIQPNGAHAWYADPDPSGNGEIDVDDTDGSTGPLDPAVEHYNVAAGAALTGNYDLWINYYGEDGVNLPAPLPDVLATVTISMYRGTPYENIQTINVNCTYGAGDEGDGPWDGANDIYGEVFVGSYYWEPLALSRQVNLQIDANNGSEFTMAHDYFESRRAALQIALTNLDTFENSMAAINGLDTGLENVSDRRSTIGHREVRLDHVIDDLKAAAINLSSACSRIQDADMAVEATLLTKAQLFNDVAGSIMVHAINEPSQLLTLLGAIT